MSELRIGLVAEGPTDQIVIECNHALDTQLAQLPLDRRIRKKQRDYRRHANAMTNGWTKACAICQQARAFHQAVQAAV